MCRLDTPLEVEYYRHGGILHRAIREILKLTKGTKFTKVTKKKKKMEKKNRSLCFSSISLFSFFVLSVTFVPLW